MTANSSNEGEKYMHSPHLFISSGDKPMKFSMRPCDERTKLKPAIEHGGGIITSKSTLDSVRLAEPGSKVLSDNCISSNYIWDCVKANKILPLQNYKVVRQVTSDNSDFSDGEENGTVKLKDRRRRIRREYTHAEDREMLDFICSNNRHTEITGRKLWQDMELKRICNGRTWQSMNERFRKQILPKLSMFSLSEYDLKRLKNPCKEITDSDENVASDDDFERSKHKDKNCNLFSPKQDLAILNYILQEKNFREVRDAALWREMQARNITKHQWSSMKQRFFKTILPNISNYKVEENLQNDLTELIEYLSDGKLTKPLTQKRFQPITISTRLTTNNDKEVSIVKENRDLNHETQNRTVVSDDDVIQMEITRTPTETKTVSELNNGTTTVSEEKIMERNVNNKEAENQDKHENVKSLISEKVDIEDKQKELVVLNRLSDDSIQMTFYTTNNYREKRSDFIENDSNTRGSVVDLVKNQKDVNVEENVPQTLTSSENTYCEEEFIKTFKEIIRTMENKNDLNDSKNISCDKKQFCFLNGKTNEIVNHSPFNTEPNGKISHAFETRNNNKLGKRKRSTSDEFEKAFAIDQCLANKENATSSLAETEPSKKYCCDRRDQDKISIESYRTNGDAQRDNADSETTEPYFNSEDDISDDETSLKDVEHYFVPWEINELQSLLNITDQEVWTLWKLADFKMDNLERLIEES